MTAISIRRAAVTDTRGISRLLDQLGHPCDHAFIEAQIRRFSANDNQVALVAVSDRGVVGFLVMLVYATFHHRAPVVRILDLCVLESERRKQIGERLVEAAASLAKEKACSKLEVSCRNFRIEAHKFYARMGFEQTHRYFTRRV